MGAATAAWNAGQPERALALLDRASPIATEPRARSELDHVRGEIEFRCGALVDAYETLVSGAARAAALDSHRALEMLFDAANAGAYVGDYGRVAEAAQRAVGLSRRGDEKDRLLAGLLLGVGSLQKGESARELPRILDAIAHAVDFDEPRWLTWAAGGAQVVGTSRKRRAFCDARSRRRGRRRSVSGSLPRWRRSSWTEWSRGDSPWPGRHRRVFNWPEMRASAT